MTTMTKTYRGRTLEELLPKIREEVGPNAVITHQREGLVGGIGGFFARRCVEVEVSQAPAPASATPSIPAQHVFDAYDAGPEEAVTATRTAVIDAMIAQAAPFADMLEIAEREAEPAFEQLAPIEEPAAAAVLPDVDADFEPVRARLLELGMPEAATAALIRE